ncbi:hypothetical protein SAMN05660443_0684 [Marinospirillum celere]|uniref:Uncharacterized protein n=1 Tax=Marinospirillum celere TaxID=1122252 RepID=A0A1I1ESJ6_9GAMM|nr:hypothetical protein [Marinospirillum celere]SFB87890.1 hypothetical protein SAMN05660443_0684 [Marinospirillum celere]
MKALALVLLLLTSLGLTGCANLLSSLVPDVYLVDRHTVMEADAAGDWPELEQRLRSDIHSGPQAFSGLDERLEEEAAFQVLNDEYVSEQKQP